MFLLLPILLTSLLYAAAHTQNAKCPDASDLYHNETQACFTQLKQGPCMENQWLVRMTNETGKFGMHTFLKKYSINNTCTTHTIRTTHAIAQAMQPAPPHPYCTHNVLPKNRTFTNIFKT
jgi:hypothetical protein